MKFQDEYRKSVEEKPVDPAMLYRTKERAKEPRGRKRTPVWCWAVSAVACCMVLVLAGVSVAGAFKHSGGIQVSSFTAAKSYDETYRVIDSLIPRVTLWDRIVSLFTAKGGNSFGDTDGSAYPPATAPEHSNTNTQVAGVDEADVFKNDGTYLYYLIDGVLYIVRAEGVQLTQVAAFRPEGPANEIYVAGDILVLLGSRNRLHDGRYRPDTVVSVYDISDRSAPVFRKEFSQQGGMVSSRLTESVLYVMSSYTVQTPFSKRDPETYIPAVDGELVPAQDIYYCANLKSPGYTVLTAIDLDAMQSVDVKAVLGASNTLYLNGESLLLASYPDYSQQVVTTQLSCFALENGTILEKNTAVLPGNVLNQFSLDEYDGFFRVAVTERVPGMNAIGQPATITVNSVFVFDREMNKVGELRDLAPDERIYSARFEGERGFLVTYRETDPLFCLDLSDPTAPRLLGELKIPGYSTYLHLYGENMLFGLGQEDDGRAKLSMYDVSDPEAMTEDKCVLDGYFTEAAYNHKALLISPAKNLIGCYLVGRQGASYAFYSYEQGFAERISFALDDRADRCRGAYIGDTVYVLSQNRSGTVTVIAADLNRPESIHTLIAKSQL